MKKRVIVYWLIPAQPERELFRRIIRILAQELKAPPFEPHLTLFATENNLRSVDEVRARMKMEPIRLKLAGIYYSAAYTKTLFARFRQSEQLNALAARLQSSIGKRAARIADPHLSLCYKRLGVATKREIAKMLRLPLRDVLFDAVYAARCASPTRTAADVEAWEILARMKMSSRLRR